MLTPLGWAASRFELGPRALRWSTTAALIVSIVIVFTGGLVRVTGSGLGCPTWPTCDGVSLAPSAELGIHGVIEFTNRLLTTVIVIAVGWVIIAARLQRPRVRQITRLAWSQFWLVVANAIAGGITVLVQLNPWVVALHFVLAIALLATTALTWHRVHQDPAVGPRPLSAGVRHLSVALVVTTLVLIVVGTLVSGSGPHSGDSAEVPRMPLNWTAIAIVHGLLGAIVLMLAVAILLNTRDATRRQHVVSKRVITLIVLIVAQGVLGIVQARTGLPVTLVAIHLLGSALVWVGALRVLLDADPGVFAGAGPAEPRTPEVAES
jgi:heme a synthase